MDKEARERFDITQYYGNDREKIDWSTIEKTQLGMGKGESVVYHNKEEILKVFFHYYKHVDTIFLYEHALEAYKKRHHFWSQNPIHINTKDVVWGDLLLRQYIDDSVRESNIDHIVIKTLDLNDSIIELYPHKGVTILKNIPYIEGVSLQSMCHGPYEGKGKILYDTKDMRRVKVGPKQAYRIGYSVTDIVNNYVYGKYNIYCGELIILFMICHIGLVPKNMKLTDIDHNSKTLTFTVMDWCSDIMLRYIHNHKSDLFQNLIDNNDLIEQKPGLFSQYDNLIHKIKHQIDRIYIHKR